MINGKEQQSIAEVKGGVSLLIYDLWAIDTQKSELSASLNRILILMYYSCNSYYIDYIITETKNFTFRFNPSYSSGSIKN